MIRGRSLLSPKQSASEKGHSHENHDNCAGSRTCHPERGRAGGTGRHVWIRSGQRSISGIVPDAVGWNDARNPHLAEHRRPRSMERSQRWQPVLKQQKRPPSFRMEAALKQSLMVPLAWPPYVIGRCLAWKGPASGIAARSGPAHMIGARSIRSD